MEKNQILRGCFTLYKTEGKGERQEKFCTNNEINNLVLDKLSHIYILYMYEAETQKSSQKHTNYVPNPLNIKELQQIWRNAESTVLKYIDFA